MQALTTNIEAVACVACFGILDLDGHFINEGPAVISTSIGNLICVIGTVRSMSGQSMAALGIVGAGCVLNEKIADLSGEEF